MVERRRSLERGLIRVRWFGVAFAFFQIFMGTDPPCPPGAQLGKLTNPATSFTPGCEPGFLRPLGYELALLIAVINISIWLALRRARDEKALKRLGVAAFLADHLVLIAFTWLYSFTLETSIWVLLYILPLEGALRYGMRGSLTSLGILAVAETARDIFRQQMWDYPFHLVPDVTFRIGIMTIIGLVAGMMARNLERERQEVERKAIEASALAEAEATARREAEAVLAQQQETVERLTQLDEMKSDFIAITSHELRTPLTSILGFLKTLRRQDMKLKEEDRENYLQIVESHSQKLLEVVEDLLFVSRIEQGAMELRQASFDLMDLTMEVIATRFPEFTGRIKVSGTATPMTSDRDRVKRVIFSLMDNAIKFSPPSSEITVKIDSSGGAGRFEITDRGVGIPPEETERIFDRFHQVGGSMRRTQAGFGLGLYVVRRIVESLGGEIGVESELGRGSCFTVRLPVGEAPAAGAVAS